VLSGFSFSFEIIFNQFNPPREAANTNQSSLFASGSFAISNENSSSLLLKGILWLNQNRKYKKHNQVIFFEIK
jgi:hypothetical protein